MPYFVMFANGKNDKNQDMIKYENCVFYFLLSLEKIEEFFVGVF